MIIEEYIRAAEGGMSMNIYIPDIKLPKDEPGAFQVIVMYVGADGKLRAECDGTHEVTVVPPHGRLIDASESIRVEFYDEEHEDWTRHDMTIDDLLSQSWVDADAPTIIPAEEGET